MPTKIAMCGDSYVSRLQDYCDGDLRVPASIYWCGKGGLRTDFLNKKGVIDKYAKSSYDQLKSLRPDVFVINVGGNDLSTRTKPREIYNRIIGLVHDVQKAGVKDVYVAERMTRADLPSNEEKNSLIFDAKRSTLLRENSSTSPIFITQLTICMISCTCGNMTQLLVTPVRRSMIAGYAELFAV